LRGVESAARQDHLATGTHVIFLSRFAVRLRRASAGLALAGALVAGAATGSAHDLIPGLTREDPNTTFESLIESCAPCARDSYAVSALPLVALKAVGFGPPVTAMMSRGGEVRIGYSRVFDRQADVQ
jgi:hypothetical protein